MKLLFVSVSAAAIAAMPLAAFAQTAPQPPSAVERALSNRVLAEVSANVQANARIVQLEDDLAKANARIKELEAAKEPPKEAK